MSAAGLRYRLKERPVWLGVLSVAVACRGGQVRDATRDTALSLDPRPLVVIGHGDANPLYGVVGAALLATQIAVASGGTHTIHFYDQTGMRARSVGRQGAGPGEFANLTWIQVADGHLFVYDSELNRISEFAPDGAFVRSVTIAPPAGYLSVRAAGILPDRGILADAAVRPQATYGEPIRYRPTLAVVRYDAKGRYRDSLVSYAFHEKYAETWGRGGQIYFDLPFGRRGAIAVHGWHFYVVDNNDAGINEYDTTGTKTRTLWPDLPQAGRPVTEREAAGARRRLKARLPRIGNVADVVDRLPIPDTVPPYGWEGERQLTLLRVGRDGAIWVLEFSGPDTAHPTWIVLRPDGTVKARVTADEELDILYADEEFVLVHRWDELDVETVELRRIGW